MINLQEQIKKLPPGGQIKLKPGEYNGPVELNNSIIVEGNHTTIWGKDSPVIKVSSRGVVLRNLQVEVTGNQSLNSVAIQTSPTYGTIVENVEVKGQVVGFGDESGTWAYPLSLDFGHLPHGQSLSYKICVLVPVSCHIVSNIAGITFVPDYLGPGLSEVSIKISPLIQNSIIHGNSFLVSKFLRRICIGGTVVTGAISSQITNGQLIWSPNHTIERNTPVPPAPLPTVITATSQPVNVSDNLIQLKKGQRIDLVKKPSVAKLVLGLGWTGRAASDLEIDAVAFLLGQNDKVIRDQDFVFYGNQCSIDGSVELLGSKLIIGHQEQICVDLAKVDNDHKKIVIALVIYQGKEKQQGFSQLSQVFVKVCNETTGKDLCFFEMGSHTTLETILIAVELYRYKGKWKLAAVGSGYREDLAFLCRKYGVEVEG